MAILIPLYTNVSHYIVVIVVVTKSVPLYVLCACVQYIYIFGIEWRPFSRACLLVPVAKQLRYNRVGGESVSFLNMRHIHRFRCPF